MWIGCFVGCGFGDGFWGRIEWIGYGDEGINEVRLMNCDILLKFEVNMMGFDGWMI